MNKQLFDKIIRVFLLGNFLGFINILLYHFYLFEVHGYILIGESNIILRRIEIIWLVILLILTLYIIIRETE